MKLIAATDDYAVFPHYYCVDSFQQGERIEDLLSGRTECRLDAAGIQGYLDRFPSDTLTCFDQIRKLPPRHALYQTEEMLNIVDSGQESLAAEPLESMLCNALEARMAGANNCALALSGGLDSALILALIKNVLKYDIPVYTVATGMSGYCELESTAKTARYFGVELNVVNAYANDFIRLLPDFIRAAEVPLYNLHPVSKMILARNLRENGFDCVITGDAADQAFCGVPANNYLPIIGAMMRYEGLGYFSPFFDSKIVAFGKTVMDEKKTALREIADSLLPEFLLNQPKVPRLAPKMDVSRYWHSNCIEWISEITKIPCKTDTPQMKTLWTTLGILVDQYRGDT